MGRVSRRTWLIVAICFSLLLVLGALILFSEGMLTTPKAPPRPEITRGLLDDRSLAIAESNIPKVNDAWREDIKRRYQVIRSLWSEDFSDLQFLKPLLEGKRVIQLGESSHGIAEFNWLKVRLIKFLHKELGYDVLAFESSMTACDGANKQIGVATPKETMGNCIFGVWRTEEVLPLFDYLREAHKSTKPLALAGVDTQSSSNDNRYANQQFVSMLEHLKSPLAGEVVALDGKFRLSMPAETEKSLVDFYTRVANELQANQSLLREKYASRPEEVDMAIQEAKSRVLYARQLAAKDSSNGSEIRDLGMANNLDLLLDKIYPKRKMIVWAHNFHITYARDEADTPKTMGVFVGERRRQEVYTVGIFMGRGVGALNDRTLYVIRPPSNGSFEGIMANAGRQISFVDFSQANGDVKSDWISSPLKVREWGMNSYTIRPKAMFDAVIYIDSVTPPKYL
ncbi:MAG: erythromycin esterase family protein [Rhodocyclaceae bacterium]|nr:erythromycin esterase family protein [Rhodocyclaceae bacterium]